MFLPLKIRIDNLIKSSHGEENYSMKIKSKNIESDDVQMI